MNKKSSLPGTGKWGGSKVDLIVLTLLWLVGVAIVNPIGDFPLNDDWSFGLAVEYFIQTGSFHPTGWTAMPLITNVVWGSLFCLPDGFSFTALRISTLVAGWLGIGGVYWLMREIRQPRLLAFLAAFVVAFNPIYFELSNTFMTDVPFFTLMIFSTIFFLRNLNENSLLSLGVATVLSIAAILSRQVGLAIPLAFAMVAICQRGMKVRTVLPAVLPLILGTFTLLAFQHWLRVTGKLPSQYNSGSSILSSSASRPAQAAIHLVHNSYLCLMYVGLYLSPVLFFMGLGSIAFTGRKWIGLSLIWLALAALGIIWGCHGNGFTMPLAGNAMNIWGLGPLTLHDVIYDNVGRMPMLGPGFWLLITLISLAAAGLIIHRLSMIAWNIFPGMFSRQAESGSFAGLFLLLISIIYIMPFMLNVFYDRYSIPVVPFLIGGLAFYEPQNQPAPRKFCHFTVTLLAAGFFIFSVCGVRDYLAWNRVRWVALDDLMEKDNIKPSNIDGGLEFNGYYLYSPTYKEVPGKSFWWIDDDSYMVTFNPIPGYSILRNYHYAHWLPPFTGNIFILKKDSANLPATPPKSAVR